MADTVGLEGVDTSQIFSSMWDNLPPELASKFDAVFQLGTIIIYMIIAYLIILILVKILSFIFGARRLKRISKNLEKTNEKLDEIASLLKGSKSKDKDSEKKKK